jgi:hypothetical protein
MQSKTSRPLSEGSAMGVYMNFDRMADKAWTPAEYMVKFAQFVSAAPSPSPQPTDEATDAGRLDWLETQIVDVKGRFDFGQDSQPETLRQRIDAARLATPPDNAAGREGVK